MEKTEINVKHKTNVWSVGIIQVIKVQSRLGDGTEEDPVRMITEYYDLKGNLLARQDALQKESKQNADL